MSDEPGLVSWSLWILAAVLAAIASVVALGALVWTTLIAVGENPLRRCWRCGVLVSPDDDCGACGAAWDPVTMGLGEDSPE